MKQLYKYYTAGTALNVLQQQTLRYSAPHLLAEPFSPDHNSEVDFSAGELINWLSDYLVELLFSEPAPPLPSIPTPLLQSVRQWRENHHFKNPAEAYQHLQPLVRPLVRHFFLHAEDHLSQWRQFARQVRICCYCQQPDNLFAWQHYGDQHRGIALAFARPNTNQGIVSRAVNYQPYPPLLIDAKSQLADIAVSHFVAPKQSEFIELLCRKPIVEEQGGEWREFELPQLIEERYSNAQGSRYWYDDKPFSNQCLRALYIGASSDIAWQRAIIEFSRKHYPEASIYRLSPTPGYYALQRETLHPGEPTTRSEPPTLRKKPAQRPQL